MTPTGTACASPTLMRALWRRRATPPERQRSTRISPRLFLTIRLSSDALADLKTNQPLEPFVHNAKEGVAEALYGLGSAGSRQGDELPALVYLRLSLYLRPSNDLTAVTLASLFEQLKQSDQVIAAYQLVPSSSPLKMGADIQIALELDSMGKASEADSASRTSSPRGRTMSKR